MYLTEKEIMSQTEALKKTSSYFEKNREKISDFFTEAGREKFVFMGCGSSFMLCKSLEHIFAVKKDVKAVSITGGEFLVNPDLYRMSVEGAVVVILSRSGMTTEIVRAAQYIKDNYHAKIMSVTMKEDSTLVSISDFSIVLPWAYDESVCQTRTVTTLYTGMLFVFSTCFSQHNMYKDIIDMIDREQELLENTRPVAHEIALKEFSDVIVLADGPLCGIAEEGALAFTEIAMISGKYFRVLDYRHGPMVLNNKNTLTIIMTQDEDETYQSDMIEDLKRNKGTIVAVDCHTSNQYDADFHICVGKDVDFAVYGIGLISICQLIALEKALLRGVNPDKPKGLDAYITLK